jgi:hypothetical protein
VLGSLKVFKNTLDVLKEQLEKSMMAVAGIGRNKED